MSLWQRFLGWIAPTIVHALRCVVCDLVQQLTYAAAQKLGWQNVADGWICPECGKNKRPI